MPRITIASVALLLTLAACQDSTLSPGRDSAFRAGRAIVGGPGSASASLTPTPTPACTNHWATAVSGSWDDASKWSAGSVPASASVVCIDASGTYTVTLARNSGDPAVAINALAIGGATGVATLAENGASMTVTLGVNVSATGAIDFSSFSPYTVSTGGVFTNDGTITSGAGFGENHTALDASFLNRGTFTNSHNGSFAFVNHTVVNQGTMDFVNRVTTISGGGAAFEQQGGLLTGTGLNAFTVAEGSFRYSGGQVDAALPAVQSTFGGMAVVRLTGASLELLTASASPAVYLDWNPLAATPVSLTGDVGANIHLRLLDNQASSAVITFKGTLTNFGLIESNSVNQPVIDPEVLFVNRGTISVNSNLHINAPFENRAAMTFTGQGGLFFGDPLDAYDNYGTISMSSGEVFVGAGATMRIRSGSAWTGPGAMHVDNALLTGSGTLALPSVVLTNGGIIDPGLPVGTLSVGTISSPDNSGMLRFDINGGTPGTLYDQLATAGLNLASALNLVINTGPQAIPCGIVANIITSIAPGSFGWASTNGLTPSAAVQWTPQSTSTTYTLYGSNPSSPVGMTPLTLNIAEGGASAPYFVCLSRAPVTSIGVSVSPDAQETVSPGTLLFTSTDWFTPRTVSVTAVDDNVAQGTHTGTITHAIVGSDPSFNGLTLSNVVATIADNDVANGKPVAQNDAATTAANTPVTIDVRANDSDPDGDPLTITAVTQPANGTSAIVSGKVQYTPAANFSGTNTFTYTISDGKGGSATATVTVTVTPVVPVNNPPVAVNDAATTAQGSPVTINVLANDSDADGDPLVISSVTQPANGTAAIVSGKVQYTPAVSFSGTNTFTYTIGDGKGGSATATVTVTVTPVAPPANKPPVAVNDAATTAQGVAVTISVLSNDSDPDGDPLSISSVTQPASGTVTILAGNKQVRYSPAANFTGIAQFNYVVADGRGGVATGSVHVTVSAPNRAPNARDDVRTVPGNTMTSIDVLSNDSDPDGDPLTTTAVSNPAHGSVKIVNGAIQYTPVTGYVGLDGFTYTISDGRGGTDRGTVALIVTRPPQTADLYVDNVSAVIRPSPRGDSRRHFVFSFLTGNLGPAPLPNPQLADVNVTYPADQVVPVTMISPECSIVKSGLIHCLKKQDCTSLVTCFGQFLRQDAFTEIEFAELRPAQTAASWTVSISAPFPDSNLGNNSFTVLFNIGLINNYETCWNMAGLSKMNCSNIRLP